MGKVKVEGKDKDGNLFLSAITLVFDTPNANGHVYTKEVMEKAVYEYKYKLEQNRAVGRLVEINDGKCSVGTVIDQKDVSHVVTKIEQQEHDYKVDIKVLHTPKGEELIKMLKEGKCSIASNYMFDGTVGPDGVVDGDAKLISVDLVKFDD